MSKTERIRDLEAAYGTLQKAAAGILEQRDAYRDALINQRERLQYEASVIQSSLYSISQLIEDINVALGVSGPGKRV